MIINRVLNRLIRAGYWYNNVVFLGCDKFWKQQDFNLDVVNLGSTTAVYGFKYTGLPIKASNLALNSNPLLGDYAILMNYFSFLKPEKSTIILSLCPFSSLAGRYKDFDDRYYTLLYPSSIPDFSYKRQQRVKAIRNNPLSLYPLLALFSDIKHLFLKSQKILTTEEEMENDAIKWMNGWKKEFSIDDFCYPLSLLNKDAIEDSIVILKEIIGFCKSHNISLVAVIPPVYRTLSDKITPSIFEQTVAPLTLYLADNNIDCINYLYNEEFNANMSYFQNSLVLNSLGASVFTKDVLKRNNII